jgi:hypothetical protein
MFSNVVFHISTIVGEIVASVTNINIRATQSRS